jgi:hypothetical protein
MLMSLTEGYTLNIPLSPLYIFFLLFYFISTNSFMMLSRQLLGSNVSRQIKRAGVRYQSNVASTNFAAERLAVKEHAGGNSQ